MTDNPVRSIDAFVNDPDICGFGFMRSWPRAMGQPGYDPADMLKLYHYSYFNEARSSGAWQRTQPAISS
ncbi:hypothetical protein [Sphingomonas carotinifaciens]|uniref:Transposase n=1 Tax=Sphingomonas carotinifaciens TaxID=1166323 RepID=A0A1G7M099_9SPHN|nr:hypothetical protein [Sphingomonas carotinifaciens]MBB4086967.1 transposase [Sphingomonas carotinifaciens]MWC42161.1 hypothetical protein [Sphingomonas carotinifaciens]SDF55195.1 transposase [Sphingomonas carotinifaciens]